MTRFDKKVSYFFRNFWDATRYYSHGLMVRFIEDDVLFLASGIAFNVLLCIIPLLLLVSALLGVVLNSSDIAMQNIEKFLTKALPNQSQAIAIKNLTFRIINDLVEFRQSMGVFGAIVLIYTSTSLFSSVRSALHRIYHITTTTGIFLSQLKDLILVLALGWLFISINTLNWLYTLISRYSLEMFGPNFVAMQTALPDFLAQTHLIRSHCSHGVPRIPFHSVLRNNDTFIAPLGNCDDDPLENCRFPLRTLFGNVPAVQKSVRRIRIHPCRDGLGVLLEHRIYSWSRNWRAVQREKRNQRYLKNEFPSVLFPLHDREPVVNGLVGRQMPLPHSKTHHAFTYNRNTLHSQRYAPLLFELNSPAIP